MIMDSRRTLWGTLWESNFHSTFSQTLLICIATYLIIIVYSLLCIQLMPEAKPLYTPAKPFSSLLAAELSDSPVESVCFPHDLANENIEIESKSDILQFFLDALFPSTLTLLITMIAQNLIICAANAGVRYSWTLFSLVFTIIYTLSSFGFRVSLSAGNFFLFLVTTIAVVVVGLISVAQVEQNSQERESTSVGVSS